MPGTRRTRWPPSAPARARCERRRWSPACSPGWTASTSGPPGPGTRSGPRSQTCCAATVLPSRGCASASARSWSTPARMRANLDPAAAAERAAGLLAPALGRERAHEAAADAASAARTQRRPLADVLRERAGAACPPGWTTPRSRPRSTRPPRPATRGCSSIARSPPTHRPARVDPHPTVAVLGAPMSAVAVHHVVEGAADAPVVVLSNSLGATRGMWDPQVPALAERFRVVTYDTRGHGESPAPAGAVHARRPGRRPGRPARRGRRRAGARRGALARRHDRDAARRPGAAAASTGWRCCAPRRSRTRSRSWTGRPPSAPGHRAPRAGRGAAAG